MSQVTDLPASTVAQSSGSNPALPNALEAIATSAAEICGAPVAMIGVVEGELESFKATVGWNLRSTPARVALDALTRDATGPVLITDASVDPRTSSHSWVSARPGVRFYAGLPLRGAAGEWIGALSVLASAPKTLNERQLRLLTALAAVASDHLRLTGSLAASHRMLELAESRNQSLSETEERFQDIFGSVEDLIMTIAADGRILHVNKAWFDALGHPSAMIGRISLFETVHADVQEELMSDFSRVVQDGTADRVETIFVSADGRRITVEGKLMPKVVGGHTVLVRVIFRDISDRKQAEIELGQTRDAALESARLKSQFLTNLSHEIRTPMHGVDGMLGLLLETPLSDEQLELAHAARSSADSLLSIINNIIHASRLESGKLSPAVADFDLRTSVERIAEVMQVAASGKNLRLELSIEDGMPNVVRGDVVRLRQVLSNLMQNAVTFTDRGTVALRVLRDADTATNMLVRFEISDTGIGIPEEMRSKIFEPFSQGDGSSTRRHGGIGLGLTTAKQLVEMMGGTLGMETEVGEGSTFWFSVPFEKRLTEELSLGAARRSFPGARVFLIDPDESSRTIISHYLTTWAIRSRGSGSLSSALDRLRSESHLGDPYPVVIFDSRMPSAGGLELARLIKADPDISSAKLIMLTNFGEQLDDQEVRAAGVSAYLAKPVDPSALFDCLTIALARDAAKDLTAPRPAEPDDAPVTQELRSSIRILLAEDKPLNQKLTLAQLRNLGYTADAVSDGAAVIEAFETGNYDLILMDCQMPVMDGFQASVEIRRRERGQGRISIIALTANALERDHERCLSAGMDDYLSKPAKPHELDTMIARCVRRRQARHSAAEPASRT